jgi:8-oxo-dGTP pyrophosphatase MutT (NUDIX family)
MAHDAKPSMGSSKAANLDCNPQEESAMSAANNGESKKPHQATAVPYRFQGDTIEFCLVTSSAGRWIFPKGIIEPSDSFLETARLEAHEEAGLHGEVVDQPLGYYQIDKDGKSLTVVAVLMEVTRVDHEWKEGNWRKRRWLTTDKAHQLLSEDELRQLLNVAVRAIQGR